MERTGFLAFSFVGIAGEEIGMLAVVGERQCLAALISLDKPCKHIHLSNLTGSFAGGEPCVGIFPDFL